MDQLRDTFATGRRGMIDAFAAMSDLARQAGADADQITELHGRFFDGNVEIKTAFGAAVLLAMIRELPGE